MTTLLKAAPLLLLGAVAVPRPERLSMFPGWPVTIEGRAAKSSEPAVVKVSPTAQGIELIGLKEGRATVEADGKAIEVTVEASGWNLVPIMVATRDTQEETAFTSEHLTTRLVPKALVTSSVVTPPNAKYLLGQRSLVPVQAGDPLLWSMFEQKQ